MTVNTSTVNTSTVNTSEVPLRQLLSRVADMDRAAFVLLYEAMSGQVRQQALAALPSGNAADAVVAATFLQVWWLAPLYRGDSEVTAWISGIAAGRIADRQRNAATVPSAPDVHTQQRSPWSVLSSAYDETLAVVLAELLGKRGPQKAF